MNLTLADMVPTLSIPSFESASGAAYCIGKGLYKGGTLGMASFAGLYVGIEVSEKIKNPTISKIIGFAAGLFTTMAVFALTNPFTPLKDVLLFSAIAFPTTTLLLMAWVERELADVLNMSFGLMAGTIAVTSLVGGAAFGWFLNKG